MGLTFRKRDDFDKMMDDLGVSTVDLVDDNEKKSADEEKKVDPFAKFLTPQVQKNTDELKDKH